MPRHASKPFTDRYVAALKPRIVQGKPVNTEYADGASRGLGIRVSRSGEKSWRLSYTYGNERHRPSIGVYPQMGLADARGKRDEVFRALAKGVDLMAGTSPSQRAVYAFDRIAKEFISTHVERKSKDPSDARNIIRNEYIAAWGSRDIRTITRRDVHALLDTVAKRAPVQANRVKARGGKLFRWSVQRGYLESSPFFALEMPSREQKRVRVLKDSELKAIWRGVEKIGHPYAPIVKLLMVLGQRRGEVAGMEWAALEMDGSEAVWTMPPRTTKNSEPHLLPLPGLAVEIIKACPRNENAVFVFPSARGDVRSVSGFSKWKAELDAICGVTEWRPHDLRRTQASRMPKLAVPAHVIDRIQNHKLTDGANVSEVHETYNRYLYQPEMREALEKWSQYISVLVRQRQS